MARGVTGRHVSRLKQSIVSRHALVFWPGLYASGIHWQNGLPWVDGKARGVPGSQPMD